MTHSIRAPNVSSTKIRERQNLLEGEYSQHRHCELGDYQDALHGTEFAVHRHVVYEQVRKPLHISSQREENRQERHHKERPFQRTAHNEASQQEKHEDYCSDIYRPVSSLGFSEVLRHIGAYILEFLLVEAGGSLLRAVEFQQGSRLHITLYGPRGRSSLYVGNQQ